MNLQDYDIVLINTSGGKDSQTMLDRIYALAKQQGAIDQLVVIHANLGRIEWPGATELAEEQAKHYGLPFLMRSRVTKDGVKEDLLVQVEKRGMWPDSKARFCTSDHKRGALGPLVTRIVREFREEYDLEKDDEVTVLNAMGMRAEESPARAKKPALRRNDRWTSRYRIVDDWLPIHHWLETDVWENIRRSKVPHHRAYDLGMPRLSCVYCVFASRGALHLAGEHNRGLLKEYVRVEKKTGHDFQHRMKIAEVQAAIDAGEEVSGPVTVDSVMG